MAFYHHFSTCTCSRLTSSSIHLSTSDHGFALGENGHVAKNHLYDVEMRVPLGLRIPPRFTHDPNYGRTARNYVSLLDMYPTLVRLANVSIAEETWDGLQGTDLFAKSTSGTSNLEESLSGTSLAGSYPQDIYPLCENNKGDSECLIAEGLRFMRMMTNSTGRGKWRGDDERNLYVIPEAADNSKYCNRTEIANILAYHDDTTTLLDEYMHSQRQILAKDST